MSDRKQVAYTNKSDNTVANQPYFVQSLKCQNTMVNFLTPRQIDGGDVQWHYGEAQKQRSAIAAPK
jgi:hypothetical protein